jgi:peroxiredoxin
VADERWDEARLDALLRARETGARPDGAFADRLFDQLATDAGFRRAARPAPLTAGWWPWRAGNASMRLAWIVVLAAVLMALLSYGLVGTGVLRLGQHQLGEAMPAPTSLPPLAIGRLAPSWSGTLIDGRPFSTDELRGRPSVVYFWCGCASGPGVRAFVDETRARSKTINSLFVSLDEPGTTIGLATWLDIRTPVLQDSTWSLFSDAWQLGDYPALVFLDAAGIVVDLRSGSISAAGLSASLDALESGDPLPPAEPLRTPGFSGDPPMSTVLRVGAMAPELSGPALAGGEVSTRDFLGKPTVVLDFLTDVRDDTPRPNAILADLKSRPGLNVLLIVQGEQQPGGTRQLLDAVGVHDPVMFDWDGAMFERWGLVLWPTLILLDADGRAAGWYGPPAFADPVPLLDAFEAGEPLPSPPPTIR